MRIALWNGCGIDNLGDRLLDLVNRKELGRRIPGAEFASFSPWVSQAVPESWRPRRLRISQDGRWLEEGAFDAIVIGGGGLLRGPPFGHPGLQVFYLGPHPDRFHDRCPVAWNAVCSAGTGVSSERPEWRRYVGAAMDRIDVRSVRNRATRDYLLACSNGKTIEVVPDPAVLAFDPPPASARPPDGRRLGIAVPRTVFPIGFLIEIAASAEEDQDLVNPEVFQREDYSSVLFAYDEEGYVSRFTAALRESVGGWEVEVCGFGNAYGDPLVAPKIAAGVPDARLVEFSDPTGADAFRWISSLDCLVASRLHAAVLALVAGVPFVGLDPQTGASKLHELLISIGNADAYLTLDGFLAGKASLVEAVHAAHSSAAHLPAVRDTLRTEASRHFDCLVDRMFR
jgi:polysaccharide pyruvyl transferase WcaK-like protein